MHHFKGASANALEDNIDGLFHKCGKKTAEKYYDNKELFLDRLKTEDKMEKYERNRRLVDFNEIPDTLVEIFINNIKLIL